jgi:hypothetical protein
MPSPGHMNRSHSHSALATSLAIMFIGLGIFSAMKGLVLDVDQTAAYLYYTNYHFGFVLRGLLGQLFSPFLSNIPPGLHHDLLIGWHVMTLAALLLALSWLAARAVAATRRTDVLAMAILLFCAPMFTSLAGFTAQPDTLLCCLTLMAVSAIRTQRFVLAWLIFLMGVLVHQLMVFLALPLMILSSLLEKRQPFPVVGSILVGLLACALVLVAPAPDERLITRFIEHGIPPEAARSLFEDQLSEALAGRFRAMAELWRNHLLNGIIAIAYGASASLIIMVTSLLSSDGLGRVAAALPFLPQGPARSVMAAVLALGAGLSPLLILAFASDLSRFSVLSTFTAFMTADLLLRQEQSQTWSPGSRSLTFTCGSLAALFVYLPFMGMWFRGAMLKQPDLLIFKPILEFEALTRAIERFLDFYNRYAP